VILHTDFRDYYDHAIGFGVDEKVHYNRFTKEVEIVLKTQNNWPLHHGAGLLGFCGFVYPYIKLHKLNKLFSYSGEERAKVVEVCFAFSYEKYREKDKEWEELSHDFWHRSLDTRIKQFFAEWTFQSDAVFLEHKTPAWVMNFSRGKERNGIANPMLKDYQFDRIKDSNTAFQEISMYLANILVEQKEVAMIEDKYRIEQHGFDLKDSFRNQKNRRQS
jgi:hypothetical protein